MESYASGTTVWGTGNARAIEGGSGDDRRVRDVGLFGKPKGWTLVIGGNVGSKPRIAQELITELSDEEALSAIEKVIQYYAENAKKGERVGKMIDRMGFDTVKAALSK